MQKLFRSLIAVGGLAGLVACGDDVTVGGPDFTISGAPVTAISVGAKVQLTANEAATWSSSATNVATVDNTGLVTAVAAGTASITATSTANPNRKASVTITVTAPAVRNVVVSPANAVLRPGETQGFVANVDADAGVARTVTWTSSNTAVATVTAAGVVTAVAPGATTITATSTANTTVSGAASVTVRAPIPATISVQNITVTGNQNQTANVNNIAGSIDVNMNVDPGEQVVQRVEVLIDGTVACTQNLTPAQSQEMRIAAAFEAVEDVIVSCQVNTAAFNSTTGVANFFNGPHTLSVRAVIAGGSDIATPSTPLIFNNISGILATLTNDNGSDPASAINTQTGLVWIGGNATLSLIGVSYVQGTTVASVNCSLLGKNARNFTLTNGTATQAYSEGSTWSATDNDVGNYVTATPPESITCGSAVLSNGQPMPQTGASVLLNYNATAGVTANSTNASMPIHQQFRYDNVAPGATSANGVVQPTLASVTQAITNPWVTTTTSLLPSATGSSFNVLGLPGFGATNNLNSTDLGVDALTVGIWVPAAGGTLPAPTSTNPSTANGCPLTGLTSVTTGSQLAETTVSSAYPVRFVFRDALGNFTCADLGAPAGGIAGLNAGVNVGIGADFTAPTGTVTGPAANTGYNATGLYPQWMVTASDNASGFGTNPLRVNMTRLNASGSTSCVINTGASSCTGGTTAAQPLTFSGTGGSSTDGYYTTSITLADQAGNTVQLVNAQLNELDQVVPTFTGGISLPAVIAGGTTNAFTTTVRDNLDLGSIYGVVAYPGPGVNVQYPTQSISSFGAPLDTVSSNLAYNATNWIRCLNLPGQFATAANPPSTITMWVTDQTTINMNQTSLVSGAFGANAQACSGTVGNLGGTAVPISFVDSLPRYHATDNTITSVDLDGVSVGTTSSTTVTLKAVADVPLNSSADPFSRVDAYYLNSLGNLVKIGTATVSLAQTQTNRYYTYTLVWDPGAEVQTGAVAVIFIGVDAQGDGVFTGGQTVNIVP